MFSARTVSSIFCNIVIQCKQAEIKQGTLMRERIVKKQLVGFKKYLISQDLAPLTIKGYLTGAKSFYRCFDIDLPNLPRNTNKPRPLKKHSEIPTKDEIREVLKVCDVREKAMILVGASSGLSGNEIVNLKLQSFLKGYDPETEITTLDLRREKVGFDFITFLTPEASRAVWDYLNYRNRNVETNLENRKRQLRKQHTTDDKGYLFIKKSVHDDYLKTGNEEFRKIDNHTFLKLYRTVSDKAGKASIVGDWNKIRSHNMRKMFNSHLLNAGCDSFMVEYWMGHTLGDTQAAYFRSDPEKMKALYQAYIPQLTIQKELDLSESVEYIQVIKENDVLRSEITESIQHRRELQEVKAELESMKAHQTALSEILDKLKEDPEIMMNALNKAGKELKSELVWIKHRKRIKKPFLILQYFF